MLERVREALPPKLAAAVVSAGLEQGRLTIGVVGAVWASRLRYSMERIQLKVSAPGIPVHSVRIRVVPPPDL